jgi:hypothetical protein
MSPEHTYLLSYYEYVGKLQEIHMKKIGRLIHIAQLDKTKKTSDFRLMSQLIFLD